MIRCAYCKRTATTTDALGLDACAEHRGEANGYTAAQQKTPLQRRIMRKGIEAGVEPVIFEASDHPFSCTCEKCRAWWRMMGPDPDNEDNPYGPFGAEVEA